MFGPTTRRWCGTGLAALAAVLVVPTATTSANGLRASPASKQCLVPGVGKPLDRVWQPDMVDAIGYNDTRTGDIAFAVRTDGRFYSYRPDHVRSGRRASSRRC